MTKIVDLDGISEIFAPSRESILSGACDRIDSFLAQHDITNFDSSALLTLMERLTADLSRVLDSTYAHWFVDEPINKDWSLICQCTRIRNHCRYYVIIRRTLHHKVRDNGEIVDVSEHLHYPIVLWKENLLEQH